MNIIEIIEKKRDKQKLTKAEINYFISDYVNGKIKDYQASSLLMAICLNGMDEEETTILTEAMLNSGDIFDLSKIEGIKVDKHSTGGVGDKVTLIVAPLLASLGLKVAKMSGRGLGHTGGTIDKLEGIPGFQTSLTKDQFINQVNDISLAIIGQTGNLVPADKMLYALRDVTGTVSSIPLIASSIMSKKLASGAEVIILDVKVGKGAFMKTVKEAIELANLMVKIGTNIGRKVMAILTSMDSPLGNSVGNNLEVNEALLTLKGKGAIDLTSISIEISAHLAYLAGKFESLKMARQKVEENLKNGKALNSFIQMIKAQGGNLTKDLEKASKHYSINAKIKGVVSAIDSLKIGQAAMLLGAGRMTKEDEIDYKAGIIINKKPGDKIEVNENLCDLYTNKELNDEVKELVESAFHIAKSYKEEPLIIKIIES
ncbi:MAG: pyrimidine-nucleoside phosphorylase [Erysipelotrichales bacterium]|nr:pyrimidine-nucleoside phosphorylase [Erysipelotrichales bacterium]